MNSTANIVINETTCTNCLLWSSKSNSHFWLTNSTATTFKESEQKTNCCM